jgi:hypothetical protein
VSPLTLVAKQMFYVKYLPAGLARRPRRRNILKLIEIAYRSGIFVYFESGAAFSCCACDAADQAQSHPRQICARVAFVLAFVTNAAGKRGAGREIYKYARRYAISISRNTERRRGHQAISAGKCFTRNICLTTKVSGDTVLAYTGGDLNITSLQEEEEYSSKLSSTGLNLSLSDDLKDSALTGAMSTTSENEVEIAVAQSNSELKGKGGKEAPIKSFALPYYNMAKNMANRRLRLRADLFPSAAIRKRRSTRWIRYSTGRR